MASSRTEKVGGRYMAGLIAVPVAGWTLGTFIGAAASSLLPPSLRSALGIAIYGMFIAIVLPPTGIGRRSASAQPEGRFAC